ncbi:MAG TPA: Ig-like domain-containing protein, partial [Longimicrobiales bacterium]|nr:Ig-like domain-containing protein [Longimicrobiales bacterium]
ATADSLSRVAAISVSQTVASVTVTPDTASLVPGGTVSLAAMTADRNGYPTAALVTWASSDTAVATVNGSGLVTAKGTDGTATVSATANGIVGTATIVVLDVPVATVEVEPSALSLALGASATLSATFRSAEGVELVGPTATWTSDDPGVAQVGTAGKVTAIGEGTTWVHATVDDTVAATDSTSVTVTAAAGAFDIEVRYLGATPTPAQMAAFAAAEARWEEIIVGDLADLPVNQTSLCALAGADLNETVDDLVIFASVDSIDGSGGVLGQAGPCWVRIAGGLAAAGTMMFDEADLADLEASGDLTSVITHEMGHVLGFGGATPWQDILVGKGSADPYWPGATAVTEYDAAGGSATKKVPVANTGGEGTRDAHWREASLGAELMTGYINYGSGNPLSAITIGAFQDIGYQVDFSKADSYTVSGALRAPGRVFQLRELPPPPPVFVTPDGRIARPGMRLR